MGTVVSLHIVNSHASLHTAVLPHDARDLAVAHAKQWFGNVENACNRFDATSELRRLCETRDVAVRVSDLLFEAAQFAIAVADASGGAFDPTVGARMEARGFDRDYRSGTQTRSNISAADGACDATYRDVELDADLQTITLHKPLLLDLGAVAKGLAIDLAARALSELQNFMIDAGGDIYVRGHNSNAEPWRVGIRHPRQPKTLVRELQMTNGAICTSGDYERTGHDGAHHLLDARTHETAHSLASVTVIAQTAMVADALATAAFALGPHAGLKFLESHDVEALLITPSLEQFVTADFPVGGPLLD